MPKVRSYVAVAAWLILGIGIGALAAVAGIRDSRNPDGLLYRARVALGAPPHNTSEADWLARTYGPTHQSMNLEEWIVRDFFRDKRDGVFVDVGAADYKALSNTWLLETRLGWSGVAIDAQDRYRAGYETNRPRSKFFALFVSDRSDEKARFFIDERAGTSSFQEKFSARNGAIERAVDVPTITLNDLLDTQHIAHVDFLSMDIELAEPKALAGFDIQRFKPELACVEVHPEVRQQIIDYFAANHYVVIGKYLRVDDVNLWFMPAGSRVRPFPSQDDPAEWMNPATN